MKPLKLTMVAFGPYAQRVELDFANGLRDNIFVITGNTGAGKTTIFDAICYALYGATSDNNGRQALELRSHFANEQSDKTYVEFEFEIHGQAYRVRRTPPQMRKKTRGEGFTEEKHTVEFKKLAEDSVSITRVEDVERELNSLLGLTLDQFKRIVMLPQGAFREFLQDKSSEKTLLLRRLFDTSFYDYLTELLGSKSKVLSENVKELATKMYTNLTHVICEAESELAGLIVDKAHIPEIVSNLLNLVVELEHSYQEELKQIKLAIVQLTELEKHVDKAREQQLLIEERGRLELRLAELNAQSEQITVMERQLVSAQLAEKNLATESILNISCQELSKLESDLQVAMERLPVLTEQEKNAQLALDGLLEQERNVNELQSKITSLYNYLPKIEQLVEIDKSLRLSKQELVIKEQALKMSDLQEELVNINKQRDGLRNLYKELQNKDKQSGMQQELQSKHELLEQSLQKCEGELSRQRELLLNSAAIILARSLREGEPCPVCGSSEHPKIMNVYGDIPTKAAVDKLERDVTAIKKELNIVGKSMASLQIELGKADAAIAAVTASADIKALIGAEFDLKKIAELGTPLTERADNINKEFFLQGIDFNNLPEKQWLQDRVLALHAHINSEQGRQAILMADVPESYRDTRIISKKLRALEQEQATCKKVMQQLRTAAEQSKLSLNSLTVQIRALQENTSIKQLAVAEWQAKHRAFLQVNFATDDELYKQAKMLIENIPSLQQAVQEHQKALAACNMRLQGLSVLILAEDFDLPALVSALADAREALQNMQEQLGAHKNSLDNNKRILQVVQADLAESGEKIRQHALVSKLFRLANGGGIQRMKLETFVLSTYFDDILAHANVRLQKMTNNQYLLIRRVESAGRGFKGLDIDVDDAHTGKLRSVSTLSGGESFKASLALALGLADVVQANAGGIRLDTMLIDEGFGTLDEESLDVAIDTLMELQEHGRVIGVISHVPALKNRVACKLVVEKGIMGSNAYFE